MPRPLNVTFTPSTVSTTFFATAASGTSLTLSANNIADGSQGLGHQITFQGNGAGDLSAINVTIIGIDQDNRTQTETFALPNGTAVVTSTLFYKTLTSATAASTTGANTLKIGFNNVAAMQTFPLCHKEGLPFFEVWVTGTINYTLQYTGDRIQQGASRPYKWISDAGSPLAASSISAGDGFTVIPLAVRILINSYSTGATLTFENAQKNY